MNRKTKLVVLFVGGMAVLVGAVTLSAYNSEHLRIAEARTKFEKVDRALKAVQTTVEAGVTYTEYGHKVNDLALEVAMLRDQVEGAGEKQMFADYAAMLVYYQDAEKLWDFRFAANEPEFRKVWHLKEDEAAAFEDRELVHKYHLAVQVKELPGFASIKADCRRRAASPSPTVEDGERFVIALRLAENCRTMLNGDARNLPVVNVDQGLHEIWLQAVVHGIALEVDRKAAFTPRWEWRRASH